MIVIQEYHGNAKNSAGKPSKIKGFRRFFIFTGKEKNREIHRFSLANSPSANERKKRAKFLLMDKAVVTLLIRSFRGGQETIAHYLYALSYFI